MQRRMFVAVFITLCLVASTAAHAKKNSANAVVEALHASLLTMMKDADTLGFDGCREHMEPVVAQSYNLPIIAVMATGPN